MSEVKLGKIISFKRDTAFRKQFFVPDSFSHPAKMDAQLCLWLTEKYTKVGDVILDPMAGSGTEMIACTIGRNVVLVELEDKFCKMMRASWKVTRRQPQLQHKLGWCEIIQGDARNLEGLLADCVITSPPYAEVSHHGDDPNELEYLRPGRSARVAGTAGEREDNIGQLPYGNIDAVIGSPPYETPMKYNGENKRRKVLDGQKLGQRDDVYFSKGNIAWQGLEAGYGNSEGNIGNLKAQSYLEAMLAVYQQCYKVLKLEGLMILVIKNFIRDKKIVRLDLDTIKLCEQADFGFIERLYRKLPSQSFWRIIYHAKYPQVPMIEYEDVLVFQK